MTYVIAEPCIDVLDRSCLEECPADCIYEGARALYIHPDECVDCGACEPVCPVEAIYYEDDVPEEWAAFTDDNVRFFTDRLLGAVTALGSPGGAAKLGAVGADTPLVAGHPSRG
ncbi:ferredoxin [Actinomycetospora chibensis]|uniref:Ferredoxin n=1 Tax=Actinomycetospora chibensis TaxID=663606 RepID=A0ABV9RQU1_9PSEU|nr:ferredoxin [Actinomycetospora chibensis]MDD7927754.1 ferredoxin family protein [Actinomycetospora chibensis]